MKTRTIPSSRTSFICEVCGYESDNKAFMQRHEFNHGRRDPFEIAEGVTYKKVISEYDHGKQYDVEIRASGIIVRSEDKEWGLSFLIEKENGEREWVSASRISH